MENFFRVLVAAICVLFPLSSVPQSQRSDDDRRPNQGYGISYDRWQGRLSVEDQGRFDSYFSRWLNYAQTNDRDNRNSMAERMRDVMSHYNIPSDVPFDQIASNNTQGYRVHRRADQEGNNDDRGQRGYRDRQRQSRLSAKDQDRFDSYYSRWLEARGIGDRHETANMEKRMLGLMAHYSIPPDTQFAQIASDPAERGRRH